jgi:hypothetical protein
MKKQLSIYALIWTILLSSIQLYAYNDLTSLKDSAEVKSSDSFATSRVTIQEGNTSDLLTETFTHNLFLNNKNKTLTEDYLFESTELRVTKVYPNPVTMGNHAFIDYKMIQDIKAKVTVRNVLGRVVQEYDLQNGSHIIKIPTSECNPGVYFCVLSINGKAKKGQKIIIK